MPNRKLGEPDTEWEARQARVTAWLMCPGTVGFPDWCRYGYTAKAVRDSGVDDDNGHAVNDGFLVMDVASLIELPGMEFVDIDDAVDDEVEAINVRMSSSPSGPVVRWSVERAALDRWGTERLRLFSKRSLPSEVHLRLRAVGSKDRE